MHKPKSVMDTTDDKRIYNRARKAYLERIGKISCVLCPYHDKENQDHKLQKSWKKNRKAKYRIASIV